MWDNSGCSRPSTLLQEHFVCFLSFLFCCYYCFEVFFLFCLFVCLLIDRVSLYSLGCSRTGWLQPHRGVPASASQVLGLKACTTTRHFFFSFEARSYYIVLGDLETTMKIRLAFNLWPSSCLCLLSTEILNILSKHHHI